LGLWAHSYEWAGRGRYDRIENGFRWVEVTGHHTHHKRLGARSIGPAINEPCVPKGSLMMWSCLLLLAASEHVEEEIVFWLGTECMDGSAAADDDAVLYVIMRF
jgi:hypothetical protein